MEFRKSNILPDGYLVNGIGEIKSPRGKILKNYDTNNCGYRRICIKQKPKLLRFAIHRVVAEAFIQNPNNLPQVNHKDGNKLNNDISNLEWVTRSQNVKHAIATGLFIPNTKAMTEWVKKNGSWNKGKHTGNQYTKNKYEQNREQNGVKQANMVEKCGASKR